MNSSKVTHGISVGDTWVSKIDKTGCKVGKISIACGGNGLIFFTDATGEKHIKSADNFCEEYEFKFNVVGMI